MPSNLITVPSCKYCNEDASLDEEYFRACVLATKSNDHPEGRAVWKSRVVTGLVNRPSLLRLIRSQIRQTAVHTPAGIYLGDYPTLDVDASRLERVIAKVVKGLYFHHVGKPLGDVAMHITTEPNGEKRALAVTSELLAGRPGARLADGTFTYRFGIAEDKETASIWWLLFYDTALFTVFVGVDEEEEETAVV
jgi:hypothetical protein